MTTNLWFYYAISSAVLWGLAYCLSDKILREGITIGFLMTIINLFQLAFFIAYMFYERSLHKNMEALKTGNLTFIITVMALSYIIGNLAIFHAISLKNASYANLIEISYPLFTILFSYLIFKNFEISLPAILGGILIFSGIAIIYIKG